MSYILQAQFVLILECVLRRLPSLLAVTVLSAVTCVWVSLSSDMYFCHHDQFVYFLSSWAGWQYANRTAGDGCSGDNDSRGVYCLFSVVKSD